ncbi:hypothetical protein [Bradyrhizobium lablabi]|uniref:hypothetical protein n=1 Tax=Bradyrhizobium lablabi TaxID=722472 RepID=UPI001BABFE0E|nr:hypothetical protein [Bradyrhizobium lablabi]MBR0697665.1 hypothetical protein [Bradyrhizobium lablabi]
MPRGASVEFTKQVANGAVKVVRLGVPIDGSPGARLLSAAAAETVIRGDEKALEIDGITRSGAGHRLQKAFVLNLPDRTAGCPTAAGGRFAKGISQSEADAENGDNDQKSEHSVVPQSPFRNAVSPTMRHGVDDRASVWERGSR